ncbi:MAG: hypothetical protein WCH43_14645 [Verrucomicrobiota bacterium]
MKIPFLTALLTASLVLPAFAGPFDQKLDGGSFSIRIQSPNAPEHNSITLAPIGLKKSNTPITVPVENQVARAFLADMDGDNSPELFIVLANSGSGSYGEVLAYSTNGKKSLTPIFIQKPAKKDLAGYMGHDEFEVMENRFVRRFPVYKKSDSNASPTGGYRQFQYKLKPGEAAWQLRIVRVESY